MAPLPLGFSFLVCQAAALFFFLFKGLSTKVIYFSTISINHAK